MIFKKLNENLEKFVKYVQLFWENLEKFRKPEKFLDF